MSHLLLLLILSLSKPIHYMSHLLLLLILSLSKPIHLHVPLASAPHLIPF